MKNFVQRLPARVNRILDRLADNEFRVHVEAIDEARLMEGMQKVANRIALGLVLAALIVGAALLMDVETSFRILVIPGAKLRKGLQASRCLVRYARAPCGSSSSTTTWTTRKASAIC